MRRLAHIVFLILTLLSVGVPSARGLDRYVQSIDVPITFTWSSAIHLPKGDLASVLQFPLRIAASGLPNKVIPTETFQVPLSITLNTGVQLSIGDQQFDLDPMIQFALSNVPQEVDLRPFVTDFTCAIAKLTLDPVDSYVVCGAAGYLVQNIRLSLLNQLTVTPQGSGPVDLQNSALNTWFGKSTIVSLEISSLAQRGQQVALAFVSTWSASIYFDFQQSVYDNPVAGALFKKIRDLLHLPWQPSLDIAQSSSTPSMTSLVLIPDFQITSAIQDITLNQGQSASFQLTATPIDEFDNSIDLTASQIPLGVQAYFSNAQIASSGSTSLTFATSDSSPTGDYQTMITATGGGKSHTLYLSLHIKGKAPGSPVTPWPAGPDISGALYLGIAFLIILGIAGVVALSSKRPKRSPLTSPVGVPRQVRFCRFCGDEIRLSSRYCPKCGRHLP